MRNLLPQGFGLYIVGHLVWNGNENTKKNEKKKKKNEEISFFIFWVHFVSKIERDDEGPPRRSHLIVNNGYYSGFQGWKGWLKYFL